VVTRARCLRIVWVVVVLLYATACAPKVGSDEWCNNLMDKPRGEWTAEEVKGIANHCIAT
jgi:hypothetical protein